MLVLVCVLKAPLFSGAIFFLDMDSSGMVKVSSRFLQKLTFAP
jgi:hypothetical protein